MDREMFRRELVRASTAASIDGHSITALLSTNGLAGDRGGGQRLKLARSLPATTRSARASRSGEQNRGRVHVVLGLRQHVGGDMARIAVVGDDHDLGGSGDKVDADFAREQLLRGSDIDVARDRQCDPLWGPCRAERQCRDGLRAADPEDVLDPRGTLPRARISALGCGEVTQMVRTPATCAGITVINRVDGSG